MRIDIAMIILGLLLVAAMALTLSYGKEKSRHGYGVIESPPPVRSMLPETSRHDFTDLA